MSTPTAWPQIDPGKMVHWVSILQQTPVTDISGTTVQWTEFVKTWAQIEPVRGTQVLKAGQDTTQLFLTIGIRWQTGILPNMRVKSNNGTYTIQSIENPGERNVILILNCIALNLNQ